MTFLLTNKLFKTEFWKKNNFKFQEGIIYEDIPFTFFTFLS